MLIITFGLLLFFSSSQSESLFMPNLPVGEYHMVIDKVYPCETTKNHPIPFNWYFSKITPSITEVTGLKIEKIHRVLEFSQSPWLKVYIDFNTELRAQAKNEFEKEYFKLMNNSVYGRTMMNVRSHVDIRLCNNAYQLEKLIAKPNFDKRTIFTENLVAVHMKRTKITFKQPIYIEKYGNRVKLMYTDTDSLILEIKTDDFYQDMKTMLDHFDTSDYPQENIYGLPLRNKKVLGKFKDELNGEIMSEFIEPKYVKQNKKALSVNDDKRFILENGIDTLAWGHYKTNICRNDFVNHLNTLIINQNKKD
ncbi:uncharacterized protein LOC107883043 [Acyrthosiphon pisum]|uniref:DNA-directed DNA polymerase n=1 Tax=Acyrthosiphon pisum TaxID=7029 RepID=A0A8R2H6S8_ACYPI|nr:uncharacterized protein LOC107883043 [Acyrthosiphon pisum]|eukprot:XP_016657858.1 PREDICTED: uncharacterized protein LOC107883043 [Acyrthosiphon pisum]